MISRGPYIIGFNFMDVSCVLSFAHIKPHSVLNIKFVICSLMIIYELMLLLTLLKPLLHFQMKLPHLFSEHVCFICLLFHSMYVFLLLSINNIKRWGWKTTKTSLKIKCMGGRMSFLVIRVLDINYLFIPCLWLLIVISSQQLDPSFVNTSVYL